MSYDTNKTFAYVTHGKKLRLYRYRASSKRLVDTTGRVDSEGWDALIYPDETITNGLRIEYSSLEKPFVDLDPSILVGGNNPTLTEVTSPKETSHLNLNRLLSLAVVEYVKAQMAERQGNVDAKEYFMRQFYSKLSDYESNKNKVYIVGAVSPYAL